MDDVPAATQPGYRTWLACQRCAACCKWPGDVVLLEGEALAIADFLGISEQAFIDSHTRLRANRKGLSILEKPNGECQFLEGNSCSINPVKPDQCRGFPNKWRFPGWRQVCEAKPIELPEEDPRFDSK